VGLRRNTIASTVITLTRRTTSSKLEFHLWKKHIYIYINIPIISLYEIISYHIQSYLTLSYRRVSYHIISNNIIEELKKTFKGLSCLNNEHVLKNTFYIEIFFDIL